MLTAVTVMGGAWYWYSTAEPAADDETVAPVPVDPTVLTVAVPVDTPAMLPAVEVEMIDVDVEMVG